MKIKIGKYLLEVNINLKKIIDSDYVDEDLIHSLAVKYQHKITKIQFIKLAREKHLEKYGILSKLKITKEISDQYNWNNKNKIFFD